MSKSSSTADMYTASSVFLKTLADAGITHAFVNWGSDHPALLEELERQRTQSGKTALEIITCPHEMVALSAAQGYAQLTGRPAAVLVHVDVGTQGLAGALHNCDRARVPVFIYAGASPYTDDGEMKGSRNEFMMWLQDVPDQSAIARQYCRYTGQISGWLNVGRVVSRPLQFATSNPKGPVYCWARREIMEEAVSEDAMVTTVSPKKWPSVAPSALSPAGVKEIAEALLKAQTPLVITSYLGRNPKAVALLQTLAEKLAIPVYSSCPSAVNFPYDHPSFASLSYGIGENHWLLDADMILVIDCDVPYIPLHNKPKPNARIFHIDIDPLKINMGIFHIDAELTCQADAETALAQILEALSTSTPDPEVIHARERTLAKFQNERLQSVQDAETAYPDDGSMTVPNIVGVLRSLVPEKTLVLNEAISNFEPVWNGMRMNKPGWMFTMGGSSLGWGLGAAIGMSLGSKVHNFGQDLIVLIVGDGSFLFGIPSTAFWIARRYNTPFLTIVLNNGGWKSPKLSMLGVYPNGLGSAVSGAELTVGFGPESPDFSQIAVAAGGAWGKRISQASDLQPTLKEAIDVVLQERRCAVVDCVLQSI